AAQTAAATSAVTVGAVETGAGAGTPAGSEVVASGRPTPTTEVVPQSGATSLGGISVASTGTAVPGPAPAAAVDGSQAVSPASQSAQTSSSIAGSRAVVGGQGSG
ncbi:MAG: hypothetical protein ACR2QK_09040, partial [Acidimicrobiales bacterium]